MISPISSLELVFLLGPWIEGILYGFLCCIFGATMYTYFSPAYSSRGTDRNRHTSVLISISVIMFLVATFHLAVNCFRLLRAYGLTEEEYGSHLPGGPLEYMADPQRWDMILKNALFVTQQTLGGGAAIYRCWVLWNYNYKIIFLPTLLLLTNLVLGYLVVGTNPTLDAVGVILNDASLLQIVGIFYSVPVGLNVATTGLISYKIWVIHRGTTKYIVRKGRLLSIIRILIETVALQLMVDAALLGLFLANLDARQTLIECITPAVAITFNAITVRIKLQSAAAEPTSNTIQGAIHTQTSVSMPVKRGDVTVDQDVN